MPAAKLLRHISRHAASNSALMPPSISNGDAGDEGVLVAENMHDGGRDLRRHRAALKRIVAIRRTRGSRVRDLLK